MVSSRILLLLVHGSDTNNCFIKITGIVVVNPQKKLTSVIQNFTWGVALSSQDLFPAGLIVDPRTGCLVLNSRTGHVQFYNSHTKSLLYNVSDSGQFESL